MDQKQHQIIDKLSDEAEMIISALKKKKPIKVPNQLYSPHPLILEAKKALAKAETNQYGILDKWGKNYLDIRVSPKTLNRALRIMNSIVKFCEKEGVEVLVGKEARNTHIKIFDEKVPFLIREPTNRYDHVPTDKEKAKEKRYGYAYYDKYDYIPSGKLRLEIDRYGTEGVRKRWADGKKNRVEQYLLDFVINAIIVADLDRSRRIEREEEHRRWEIERQRQAELERLRQIEEGRRQELEKQADNWVKSRQLRNYINAVEAVAIKHGIPADSKFQYKKWLSWAKAHADRLDPLTDRLPFETDNDD